jgi:hypothetical protein
MEKESKSGGGLPTNGLVAVALLIAGALFVREVPLEATRPPSGEPRVAQHFSLQDIDARLWQDPFGAVERGRAEERKAKPERDPATIDSSQRTPEKLAADIRRRIEQNHPVEILAVMLGGGPYADSVEARRRVRYAVLAGLGMSHLTPADNEHLGYYLPVKDTQGEISSLPESVPYEWFEPASGNGGAGPETRPQVLVMWLQAEAFSDDPLTKVRELARPFDRPGVSWRVLGPWDSDGLKGMIAEVTHKDNKDTSRLFEGMSIRFYSQFATVPDDSLLPRLYDDPPLTLSDFFAQRGVPLVRTIGDDGVLVDALIGELELRGLHPAKLEKKERGDDADSHEPYRTDREACRPEVSGQPDAPSHIAIVTEWDSLYGRSLKREFKPTGDARGFCIEDHFTYVRGLDGLLPDAGAAPGTDGKPAANDKESARRKDGTFVERAEGQSQFDYLRRLAVQLHERDQNLRKLGGKNSGLRAIGVLGSDVNDKLLVLQALQPEFPNVIFFTLDLDARMLHPREQAWARNLLVASNFGLRLTPEVQKAAPPFRDSYQTSAFFATRLAMDDARRALRKSSHGEGEGGEPLSQAAISKWLAAPRIFEIGRTTAFDLSSKAGSDAECPGRGIVNCRNIHPSGPALYPEVGVPMLLVLMNLVVLGLWAPALISSQSRQALRGFVSNPADSKVRRVRYGALLLAFVLLQGVLPVLMTAGWKPFAEWLTQDGKPLVALEGISMWPTEGIRLVTLVLCVHLVYLGWMMLSQNLEAVGRELGILPTPEALIAEQDRIDANPGRWKKFVRMFSVSFRRPAALSADSIEFWRRHIVQNRLSARLTRTTVLVLAALGLSYLVMLALGEHSFVPYRGKLSLRVHESLCLLTAAATYFLVFFVADATVFCVRYVHALRERTATWPLSTLEAFEKQLGVPRACLCLDDWIDLRYVALRTRCVTRLVYYPFIVMSLLLVSRSWVFDHWSMPASTIVLACVSAVIMIWCVLALRSAAERSREVALERIRDSLMRMNRLSPAHRVPVLSVKQLELLHSRIEGLHEGAFAPFWQQPLPKAVLLPFATLGGTMLLDYMALANV